MDGRLALSFTVATFIAAVGAILALANVARRLDKVEATVETAVGPRTAGRPPGAVPPATQLGTGPAGVVTAPPAEGAAEDPLASRDPLVKLDHLIRKIQSIEDDSYESFSDITQDLMALKREVRQLKSTLKQVVQNIGRADGGAGTGGNLFGAGEPLDPEKLATYRDEAQKMGVKVEEGRVTVRGFLNMHPNRNMPIEYFMTRFPESGHETLVHLVGDKTMKELGENPLGALRGLGTALYKGLVAAGFREGKSSHADPNSDPKSPKWVLATGDTVYVYARYERDGKAHVARATDWVLDPSTGAVLPEDCFRFTGSVRDQDPDTGEDVLTSEMVGLFVSVWPNATSMIEVALDSATHNDYQYNFERIPRPEGEGPLYLDVMFSKTRMEPEGEGAVPLKPPSPPAEDGDGKKAPR